MISCGASTFSHLIASEKHQKIFYSKQFSGFYTTTKAFSRHFSEHQLTKLIVMKQFNQHPS
jgi:hypothetical protein